MSSATTLQLHCDARGVARITLNRPDRHNAFDETMIREVIAAFRDVGRDPAVRAVVLAAAGGSFCAGADLQWMQRAADYDEEQNRQDAGELALMVNAVYACPKPVIARVQGNAFGGGVGMVAAADVAIGVAHATFALSEVRLGIIPAVISPYVIEAIGARHARRYFLTAERLPAPEAARIGLLHQVVEDEAALDAAIERTLSALLANGPKAMEAAKVLVQAVAQKPLDDELIEDTVERIAQIRLTDEAREGIGAFLGKRAPRWSGG